MDQITAVKHHCVVVCLCDFRSQYLVRNWLMWHHSLSPHSRRSPVKSSCCWINWWVLYLWLVCCGSVELNCDVVFYTFIVLTLSTYLTLDLSSSRIQTAALGHTSTTFCFVIRQLLGFFPGQVHLSEVSFDDIYPVLPWSSWFSHYML